MLHSNATKNYFGRYLQAKKAASSTIQMAVAHCLSRRTTFFGSLRVDTEKDEHSDSKSVECRDLPKGHLVSGRDSPLLNTKSANLSLVRTPVDVLTISLVRMTSGPAHLGLPGLWQRPRMALRRRP